MLKSKDASVCGRNSLVYGDYFFAGFYIKKADLYALDPDVSSLRIRSGLGPSSWGFADGEKGSQVSP
mgnify:CR=1 FL=1